MAKEIKDKNIKNLITYVSMNPVLYNPDHEDYNKRVKSKIWESIGLLIKESGDDCKFTWNKLEKSYRKRDSKSPFAKYFKLLTFLDVNEQKDSKDSGQQCAQSSGQLNTNVGSSNHDGSPVPIHESTPVAEPEIQKQSKGKGKGKGKKESVKPEGSSLDAKEDDIENIYDRVQNILQENNRQICELQAKGKKDVLDLLNEFKAMTLNSASGGGSTSNTTV